MAKVGKGNVVVPESVLKKQKRAEEWALVKLKELEEANKKNSEFRKLICEKASQYAKDLLARGECCTFSNAEYMKSGFDELEVWCGHAQEFVGSSWDELKHENADLPAEVAELQLVALGRLIRVWNG
ncbi:myosin-8 [Phtheirospermum japonicum]|uniref:Myosin-8 n=1 Tax=Phtheirospermum japonicum TaxID=374723 RepID=A0A830D3E9_9LAMI|nr:myosin-8 [Phtheirospermum japonicum]